MSKRKKRRDRGRDRMAGEAINAELVRSNEIMLREPEIRARIAVEDPELHNLLEQLEDYIYLQDAFGDHKPLALGKRGKNRDLIRFSKGALPVRTDAEGKVLEDVPEAFQALYLDMLNAEAPGLGVNMPPIDPRLQLAIDRSLHPAAKKKLATVGLSAPARRAERKAILKNPENIETKTTYLANIYDRGYHPEYGAPFTFLGAELMPRLEGAHGSPHAHYNVATSKAPLVEGGIVPPNIRQSPNLSSHPTNVTPEHRLVNRVARDLDLSEVVGPEYPLSELKADLLLKAIRRTL